MVRGREPVVGLRVRSCTAPWWYCTALRRKGHGALSKCSKEGEVRLFHAVFKRHHLTPPRLPRPPLVSPTLGVCESERDRDSRRQSGGCVCAECICVSVRGKERMGDVCVCTCLFKCTRQKEALTRQKQTRRQKEHVSVSDPFKYMTNT